MSEQRQEPPFKSLGQRLKTLRQKLQETVADVSGAVEIDEGLLQRIEQGSERPSEDILMLLISHFGMHDDEAAGLWQLAGYDQPRNDRERDRAEDDLPNRATVFLMAVDPRVIYSDSVQINANKQGVIMTFAQSGAGNNGHPLPTARVGMSRDQAYSVLRVLQDAMQHSEPRQLPSPKNDSETKNDDQRQA